MTNIALISIIAGITIFALYTFRNSTTWLFPLLLVGIISTVYAYLSLFISKRKNRLLERIHDRFFSFYGQSIDNGKKSASHSPQEKNDVDDIEINFPQERKSHRDTFSSPISLNEYLVFNDYRLNDDILNSIEWKRFELLCNLLLSATGYNSKLTKDGADQGVDIRIYGKDNPSKVICLVQCKRYYNESKQTERSVLQQLKGQMASENVNKGAVFVTSLFSRRSVEFAMNNGIELFDRKRILSYFNKLGRSDRKLILQEILSDNYWTPSCPNCTAKLKLIHKNDGSFFWGCPNFRKDRFNGMAYYEATPIKEVQHTV